ncbi:RpiB/LacA/LacB family sugar-phosphate isomerase [Candidatus Woesearchaeota archaeon]|nr:RpiB/LacA/LacB family sugar-phosphate isomerase [Candidatus Woesearchaeota archaeon]
MVVIIGADHAGFSLKEKVKDCVPSRVVDRSPTLIPGDDYPDIAKQVAKEVVQQGVKGVLVCGSGIGMSIAANKVRGVRAAVCRDVGDAVNARQHNDANILCLGGRVTGTDTARHIIDAFFSTRFAGATRSGARHGRRVRKLG